MIAWYKPLPFKLTLRQFTLAFGWRKDYKCFWTETSALVIRILLRGWMVNTFTKIGECMLRWMTSYSYCSCLLHCTIIKLNSRVQFLIVVWDGKYRAHRGFSYVVGNSLINDKNFFESAIVPVNVGRAWSYRTWHRLFQFLCLPYDSKSFFVLSFS